MRPEVPTPPDDSAPGKLQEALASLRHQAPPGDLSRRVRERLAHPEPPPKPTFLQRLGLQVETRPVLIGLAGVLAATLIVMGILAARHVPPPTPPKPEDLAGNGLAAHPHSSTLGATPPPVQAGNTRLQSGGLPQPVLATPDGPDRLPISHQPQALPPAPGPRIP